MKAQTTATITFWGKHLLIGNILKHQDKLRAILCLDGLETICENPWETDKSSFLSTKVKLDNSNFTVRTKKIFLSKELIFITLKDEIENDLNYFLDNGGKAILGINGLSLIFDNKKEIKIKKIPRKKK